MNFNLFYRRVAPSEIKEMNYRELRYWNEMHVIMVNVEKEALNNKGNK